MRYWCEYAWLPGGLTRRVRLTTQDGLLARVERDVDPEDGDERLAGVTLPGMANTHSHCFHRALRGRTQQNDYWAWRDMMYRISATLNPDTYLALARATFAEMALAGITVVGESHYVHHRPGGKPFGDPNAMGLALRQAAEDVGIRLTLLDTCLLEGGLTSDGYMSLDPSQMRFSDGSVDAWAERMHARQPAPMMRLGAAIHSVRSIRREDLPAAVRAAAGLPLQVHLSEQPSENFATQVVHGLTPTQLLDEAGALGAETTVIHATHVSEGDMELLGGTGTGVCLCPTSERDLADGIGPARSLRDAGCPLSLGTDQHVVIDPFEELRGLEMHERISTNERGRFATDELVEAATFNGYRALGWGDGGLLAKGALADFVTLRLDTVNTAGCRPEQVMYAATLSDVDRVVVAGREIVTGGTHRLGDVGHLLSRAISRVLPD